MIKPRPTNKMKRPIATGCDLTSQIQGYRIAKPQNPAELYETKKNMFFSYCTASNESPSNFFFITPEVIIHKNSHS